ncbi:hypothetical protein G3N57_13155 [Paraburkholderia sp. Se-20369]|nr:hypothetical protein [Paraburkholderia sp. Se-20369]
MSQRAYIVARKNPDLPTNYDKRLRKYDTGEDAPPAAPREAVRAARPVCGGAVRARPEPASVAAGSCAEQRAGSRAMEVVRERRRRRRFQTNPRPIGRYRSRPGGAPVRGMREEKE